MRLHMRPLIRCNICYLFHCHCKKTKIVRSKTYRPFTAMYPRKAICRQCGNTSCNCYYSSRPRKRRTQRRVYTIGKVIRPLRIKNIQQPVKIKQPITIDKVKQPIKLASPLDIEADRLDIRPLNPVTDGVQVYGSAPTPLLTDSDGRLIITTNLTDPSQNRNYKEITFTDVTAAQEWTYLPAQDTSQLITYTYAVVNQGDSAVQIKLELSPNNVIFQFHRSWEIAPREVGIVVPAYFLHYSRIAVKSADQDRHSAVDIYFQAQQ